MMQNITNSRSRRILPVVLALLLALALVIPLAAQDTTPDETVDDLTDDDATIIIGTYGFNEDGDIIVTSADGEVYIIAPAGAFNPSDVEIGDMVIIIGRELGDGGTIQAIEFDFFVEEEEEPDPEATPEVEPEMTPEVEVTPEVTEEPPMETSACASRNHPVANRIAEEFEVDPSEVMAIHCDGNGFGNIARAYLLGREMELDPQSFIDMHRGGMGWGQIVRDSGVHPSELAPGRIGKGKNSDDGDTTVEASNSRGNNGNNGNRGNNGNNGNRGNNGNNGNGNGNGGGNGNRGGKNK